MAYHYSAKLLLLCFLFIAKSQLSCSRKAHSNISCFDSDREALLNFREGLIDKSNRLSSWSGEDCCTWEGIGCSKRTGHVVKVDLHNQMPFDPYRYFHDTEYSKYYSSFCLGGKLNPSLLKLKHLHYLDLSLNNFSGIEIPTFFGSYKNLRYLDLSSAGFHGKIPPHLGNLSTLWYLHLGQTQGWSTGADTVLSAQSLWWVSKLSTLRSLDLSGVYIEDTENWLQAINMLPSLSSLNLASCGLNSIPLLSHANFTSLTSLELQGNGFISTIPPWLFNLTSLLNLHLEGNFLRGPIPDSLAQLTSLSLLDVSSNSLSNPLPNSLCNLSSLANLYLSFNRFQGSLPQCLGKLNSLAVLDLESNELFGSVPTGLGQLAKLQRLSLSNNPLTGALCELHFLKLKDLKFLDISSTFLSWNVSFLWVPPFQLQNINMRSSKVGPSFPSWLRAQTEVKTLVMSNSSISDNVPEWFENVHSHINYLDINHNQITGKLPKFKEANGFYRSIIMYSNKFEGPLNSFPSDALAFDVSKNLLTGNIPPLDGNMTMPFLRYLNLNDNLLTGGIPDYICNIQTLLILDLSNNQLSGRVPLCLGNLRDLSILNLGNNSLSGQIPSSLGNMEFLLFLHLNKNEFAGQLPMSMQNLKNLEVLDLGENELNEIIPSWIGEKLSYVRILRLQSNNFYGSIPLQLCRLSHLQVLNLGQNKLEGSIPHCFGNLSAMASNESTLVPFTFYMARHPERLSNFMKGRELEYSSNLPYLRSLELSENHLIGEIPKELMQLVGLQSLNLSGNCLTGKIPENIGDLKQLESLDLSRNEFSGSIPRSLSTLNSLSFLNFSFNKLSGRIPSGDQLQTLEDQSIYLGNSGLCGKPLLNPCADDMPTRDKSSTIDDEGGWESNLSWFYAGMGPGFAVGFSGFGSILVFKKSWRYAYFRVLENIHIWIVLKTSKLQRKLRRWI